MGAKGWRAKVCKRGHPLTPENTRVVEWEGSTRQACRRCQRLMRQVRYHKTRKLSLADVLAETTEGRARELLLQEAHGALP